MNLIMIPSSVSKGVVTSQILAPWDARENIFYDKKRLLVNTKSQRMGTVFELFRSRKKIKKVYCRDVYSFVFCYFFLKAFLKAGVIYDFRGILHEESFLKNRSRFRRSILRAIEKFCYKRADELRSVSHNMTKYLKSEFGDRPIDVIPCCISEADIRHSSIRSNKSGIVRFIYVGSISRWQCFDDAIRIYSEIDLAKTLTVLTPDLQQANEILAKYRVEANLENASRERVLELLRESDFGFVLREKLIVNCVASPIKFLEYVSQGVVPICTPFVGDYSESFKDLACVMPETKASLSKRQIELLNKLDVKHCLIERSRKYTWENYREMFF